MSMKPAFFVLTTMLSVQEASAQQAEPNVQMIAQAYDRCMATYAVRLTHTAATDDEIFTQTTKSCLPLKGRLTAAINAQIPAPHATELLRTMEVQAKPNFVNMLARIRRDRAARAGG
jgi:hypothetical protein